MNNVEIFFNFQFTYIKLKILHYDFFVILFDNPVLSNSSYCTWQLSSNSRYEQNVSVSYSLGTWCMRGFLNYLIQATLLTTKNDNFWLPQLEAPRPQSPREGRGCGVCPQLWPNYKGYRGRSSKSASREESQGVCHQPLRELQEPRSWEVRGHMMLSLLHMATSCPMRWPWRKGIRECRGHKASADNCGWGDQRCRGGTWGWAHLTPLAMG